MNKIKSHYQFYIAEVTCFLKYLHSLKIVYRDLKPEHVIISNTGHCKIVDFGFSKKIKGFTYTNCGTAEYVAPEILKSVGTSFQADVWSLGVLVHEIYCGMTPFYDEDPVIMQENVIRCKYNFGNLTATLREFLEQIFVPDTAYRLSIKQI